MADQTIVVGLRELIWAGIAGIASFFMWLLKKSIYGRMDKMEKDMAESQSKAMCVVMQTGCQKLLLEKMDKMDGIMTEKIGTLVDKVQLVLDRQTQVINRIDSHVNGHDHKGE